MTGRDAAAGSYASGRCRFRSAERRFEPGFQDVGDVTPQNADPFVFVISQANAALAGLQVITGTDGPQCALNGAEAVMMAHDPRAHHVIVTWWALLASSDGYGEIWICPVAPSKLTA